ncbi:MAG: hypothetical protein QMC74_17495, partial [Myxococcota bacterium]
MASYPVPPPKAPLFQVPSGTKSAQEGAEYLHRSLVVRTPNIGGAEKPACLSYPLAISIAVERPMP